MSSAPLTISLTDESLKNYVEARVDSGAYGTPTEYIRDLILNDRERQLTRLENHLLDSMQSDVIDIPEDVLERGALVDFLESQLNTSR
jgi:antitoxin ParD1/3/4